MAEGYVNARYSDRYEGYSAGTEVTRVHPLAIRVMNEIGIDISHQKSKELEEFFDYEIDTVITVCDGANSVCPMFPGAKETIHVSFPDPSSATGTEDMQLEMFRMVRDDILSFIDQQFGKTDT
jgi:arsenate reductase